MNKNVDIAPLDLAKNNKVLMEHSLDDAGLGITTTCREHGGSDAEPEYEHKPMTLHEKYQLQRPGLTSFSQLQLDQQNELAHKDYSSPNRCWNFPTKTNQEK